MSGDNKNNDTRTFEWYLSNPEINWGVGIALVKDLEHRFIAANEVFTHYSGFRARELVGLKDADMPWAESQGIYVQHEKDILAGDNYTVIEPLDGIDKINLFTKKVIIYDQAGLPMGTIASAIKFSGIIEYGNLAGQSVQLKNSGYPGYSLTKTETRVLYFILKGFRRMQVVERAKITSSAYDAHVRNIKLKLNVNNGNELIDLCYRKGFHELIPYFALI